MTTKFVALDSFDQSPHGKFQKGDEGEMPSHLVEQLEKKGLVSTGVASSKTKSQTPPANKAVSVPHNKTKTKGGKS